MYEKIIKKFVKLNSKKHERYNSWNHCYSAFKNETNEKILSLHLGFYLASWGMYRGSSKLLQKDYLVHLEATRIIKKYWYLRCEQNNEVEIKHLDSILQLIKELSSYYKEENNVTATDTLISKIILGTLGCLPAFDRYFIEGVKNEGYSFKTFNVLVTKLVLYLSQGFVTLNSKLVKTLCVSNKSSQVFFEAVINLCIKTST